MTNETKPVLLTVAMAEALGAMSPECRVKMLRERGLIAPEPVDPLLIEAREIAGKTLHRLGASTEQIAAGEITSGQRDDAIIVHATLAALKRGLELAKPELTREMVREAVIDALPCGPLYRFQFAGGGSNASQFAAERFVTSLHDALTEQVRK